jgi:hypothetical protein
MCDFRNIIGVRFADGYEISGGPKGHYNNFGDLLIDDPDNGLYHVGMTGCGIFAYRNNIIYSDYPCYTEKCPKCEFIVDGYSFPEGTRIETPNN